MTGTNNRLKSELAKMKYVKSENRFRLCENRAGDAHPRKKSASLKVLLNEGTTLIVFLPFHRYVVNQYHFHRCSHH